MQSRAFSTTALGPESVLSGCVGNLHSVSVGFLVDVYKRLLQFFSGVHRRKLYSRVVVLGHGPWQRTALRNAVLVNANALLSGLRANR